MALNIGKLFGRNREQMLNNKNPELDRVVSEGQGYGIAAEDGGASGAPIGQNDVSKVDPLSATGIGHEGVGGGGEGVVMKDGANNVTLENYALSPAEPNAMQDIFVKEFTGTDEEVGALLAALHQRGLIDTSTGEVVWADEASNLSQSEPFLDWLNANHFERGPNGIMVWNGQPVSHGVLENYAHSNAQDGGASGLISEVGFPKLDGSSAPREAGSGMATGVHDIHMNQGNAQSLQQSMQNQNQRVVQHNQTDLEFARAPRTEVTANNEFGDAGPLEIKFEDVETPRSKWELSELDASKNEVAIESLELEHEGAGVVESIGVKYTTLLDDDDPGVPGITEDATDVILNIKSDSEVTDYAEGGTSLDDFNPKEAANFLPEVNDEVLVQAREPGRLEFPNLARGSQSDTMPMEEVGFIRGTGRQGPLDDDGPSTLLGGDADGDGRVETTDAMSLNFEEIKITAIQDGVLDETESDFADFDADGLPD